MTAGAIAQLRARVHGALNAQDFDAAFAAINVTMLRAVDRARARRILSFGAPEVDELCLLTGRRWIETYRANRKGPTVPSHTCDLYVASALHDSGGHTALIGDFIRATPGRRGVLAVTNLANQPGGLPPAVLQRVALELAQVEVCHSTGLTEKFAWLIDVIDRVHPDRIILFNHHEDGMAIAACQPGSAREIVFVHHSDRVPSVGAFMTSAVHLDVTPFCFCCCRQQAGLANRFVPLVATDQGARERANGSLHGAMRAFAQKSRAAVATLLKPMKGPRFPGLRTAAAGSPHKFREDYEPNYFDAVAAILNLTQGWHVHIGHLPDEDLARVRGALTACNVNPARFVHVPHVPSVWRAMADYDVDVYIGSYSTRGARTSVEVMGSGTPAVWHVTRPATLFHDTHMKYEGAATWRTLEELLAVLSRLDQDWLTQQSRLARSHYERSHHPRLLAACLSEHAIASHPVRAAWGSISESRLMNLDDLLT